MTKNISTSVHSRLLNQARATGRPLNDYLQYYAIERFLYRLSQSRYRDDFILKGALAFLIWGGPIHRSTRDIDLLGSMSNEVENLVRIAQEICALAVEDDGMTFPPENIQGILIKEDADYEGVRLAFFGFLGKARIKMQIDVGFSDQVFPKPVRAEYPTLLSYPAPELKNYPRESVIAEKFQAMIYLGEINSRMKDFYDIWFLASHFDFDGSLLQEAISQTFRQRKTEIPSRPIYAFSEEFAEKKSLQWIAFLERNGIENTPYQLSVITQKTKVFLTPIVEATTHGSPFTSHWKNRVWEK
jgi:predicted nucleotidyltransferase component of viral defense system